ncbi:ADAMTS-like protein 5 isoform X3 [Heliangelus exortis]|uniref:ADAMTS-like protein 5 isoform X3 n=1 Tax=Heliangelus exortis TaxID=472823 RepID=UPI003A8E6C5C
MGYFGYMNVTKIPAGATHIKVTDKSRSYLGRTCPISLPVSPGWCHPWVQAGLYHAVPVPPLSRCSEHPGLSDLTGAQGTFPEATSQGLGSSGAGTGPRLGPPPQTPQFPSPSAARAPSPTQTRAKGGGKGVGRFRTPGFGSSLGLKPSSSQKADFSRAPTAALPAHAALPARGEASGGDPVLPRAPSPAAAGVPGPARCSAPGHAPSRSPDDQRWALRAQRGLVHRLAGAVRGSRHPAALRPGPRWHREPGGSRTHRRGPAPDALPLPAQVLLQEPNPSIEYEFWLPHGHPQPGRGDTSPLRQPQPRGAGTPPPPEPPGTLAPAPLSQPKGFATEPPWRSPPGRSGAGAAAGRCGRCRPAKGRSQRIQHFCQSDFVFQGRILARRLVGQETRYEVEVKTPYRRRFPLVSREYLWVPNTCGCPPLREGHQYLLMARRHVNHEHTLNRILLQDDGYARPWSPREERLVREAARHCPQPRPP